LDSYDKDLNYKFGLSHKQIGRLLEEVADGFDNIEVMIISRKKVYRYTIFKSKYN